MTKSSEKTQFKKGHTPWNKGLKKRLNTGRTHVKKGDTAENSIAWSGDSVGYHGIHHWLKKNYGKPNYCEHCFSTEEKAYNWALKHDCEYKRKRENYIRLCRKCHHKYDDLSNKRWSKRKNK